MLNVKMNSEKNGIEIRFNEKPTAEILDALKSSGYRWSVKQKMWYAKQNENAIALAEKLKESEGTFEYNEEQKKPSDERKIRIRELTRTDGIESNYALYHITDTKEIAARIRKHIRTRFPMCKWRVRKEDYNSIDVKLLESPYAIDSEILKAIGDYVYAYANSYNYDNSDPYTDYFDVNFYGVYKGTIVDRYYYKQREATVAENNIEAEFLKDKDIAEKEQREKEEKAFQERLAREKIEKEENLKYEAQRKANHALIESSAKVEQAEFFVLDCDVTNAYKEDTVAEYTNDYNGEIEVKHYRENCKVARAVYLTEETYNLFSRQLLDDYTFLSGMGGTATDDLRINSAIDYDKMRAEERQTVEVYNNNCVAIYCNGILKLVVNPEGFNYARYVYFVDGKSKLVKEYKTSAGISEEEAENFKKLADELEDISTQVITDNNLCDTWNKENFTDYKKLMKEQIYNNKFPFSVGVVRAIGISDLKPVLYSLLYEYNSIQEQFTRAEFKAGQKITIIQIGDFGGLTVSKVCFESYVFGKYAQYPNAVKMTFKSEKKRGLYYNWFYRDVLIYDGWLDIPENLLWNIDKKAGTRMSKYHSCDKAQYDVTIKYFKENGIETIINTYSGN